MNINIILTQFFILLIFFLIFTHVVVLYIDQDVHFSENIRLLKIAMLIILMLCENMKSNKISSTNNKHKVFLYTLSTCAWCKLTKKFLKDNKIEYEYIDVDLCSEGDRKKAREDILKTGGELSYPAIIVDGKFLTCGFDKDKIKKALEI